VLAVLVAIAVPVSADTELKFSGQIRLREEVDKRDFDTAVTYRNWADLRTRVGLEAIVDGNTHAFVQLQDSRRMGGYDQFGHRTSGQLNDGKNVDVHQAYFEVDRLLVDGLGFKAGRFEMNFGNQRVFGAVGWSNVGRVWEGGMGWYDHEKFKITAFGLKAIEVNDIYYNADFDIGGLYATCKSTNLDVFWFYEYDADTNGYYINVNRLDRLNAGAYFKRNYPDYKLDFEFNGVYQWGQEPRGLYNPFTQQPRDRIDIAAYMLAFEAGLSFDAPVKGRIAAGIDYTTGDDDAGDDENTAYNNLYATAHKFNGFMDYFTDGAKAGRPYAAAGLVDFMVRADFDPSEDWKAKLDLHFFSTNKDYMFIADDGSVVTSNKAGIELDATIATTIIPGLHLQGGASIFMADDDFTEAATGVTNADPGLWFYTMSTVNF
jgi:hypothetical protein